MNIKKNALFVFIIYSLYCNYLYASVVSVLLLHYFINESNNLYFKTQWFKNPKTFYFEWHHLSYADIISGIILILFLHSLKSIFKYTISKNDFISLILSKFVSMAINLDVNGARIILYAKQNFLVMGITNYFAIRMNGWSMSKNIDINLRIFI